MYRYKKTTLLDKINDLMKASFNMKIHNFKTLQKIILQLVREILINYTLLLNLCQFVTQNLILVYCSGLLCCIQIIIILLLLLLFLLLLLLLLLFSVWFLHMSKSNLHLILYSSQSIFTFLVWISLKICSCACGLISIHIQIWCISPTIFYVKL